jgi:hypothetical protein
MLSSPLERLAPREHIEVKSRSPPSLHKPTAPASAGIPMAGSGGTQVPCAPGTPTKLQTASREVPNLGPQSTGEQLAFVHSE